MQSRANSSLPQFPGNKEINRQLRRFAGIDIARIEQIPARTVKNRDCAAPPNRERIQGKKQRFQDFLNAVRQWLQTSAWDATGVR